MGADLISLRGIEGFGFHGVLPQERDNGQPFLVDVDIRTDIATAARTDDVTKTLDYSVLAREVVDIVQGEPCDLIETLVVRIADVMLSHSGTQSVRVTVHKPQAPVGVPFADVSVTVERRR